MLDRNNNIKNNMPNIIHRIGTAKTTWAYFLIGLKKFWKLQKETLMETNKSISQWSK
jgi:hypothetical protein